MSTGAALSAPITQRIAALFWIKANKAIDRVEDPREVLDYAYAHKVQMLQRVRSGVADVATSRKRVNLQVKQLQQSTGKLQDQAQQALAACREDLAREALTRRTAVTSQITDLQAQQTSLQAQEEKLTLAARRPQAKVDSFRTRKETIKATYTAAEAKTRITKAVTGIGEELGDAGLAMQRAQDKTEPMQARAGALRWSSSPPGFWLLRSAGVPTGSPRARCSAASSSRRAREAAASGSSSRSEMVRGTPGSRVLPGEEVDRVHEGRLISMVRTSWTTKGVFAGRGGARTDDAGIVTGDLTVHTTWDGRQAEVAVQYSGTSQWFTLSGSPVPCPSRQDSRRLHQAVVEAVQAGGGASVPQPDPFGGYT